MYTFVGFSEVKHLGENFKIYCIGDDVERNRVGNKAYQLFDLVKICKVPPFVCIDSNAFWKLLVLDENVELMNMINRFCQQRQQEMEKLADIYDKVIGMYIPQEVIDEIDVALSKRSIQESYAVRSSSVLEDNGCQSGAGIFESYTDVKRGDVVACIKKCWAAQFSAKVLEYLKQVNSLSQLQMGVIIQKYQKAIKAGVLFTIDPVCPTNGMRMEMVDGNVEMFMQGEVNAKEVIFCIADKNGYHMSVQGNGKWEIELFRICDQLRQNLGYEVDVEWVYDGKQVYIIQCRPVTVISSVPASEWLTEIDSIDNIPICELGALKQNVGKIYDNAYAYRCCKKSCIPVMKWFLFRYGEKTDVNTYVKKIKKECSEGIFSVEENKLRSIHYCESDNLLKNLENMISDLNSRCLTVSIRHEKFSEYSALSYYDPLNKRVRIEYSKGSLKAMKYGYLIPLVCLVDSCGRIEKWIDCNGMDGKKENEVTNIDDSIPLRIRKWISIIARYTIKLYHHFILSILEWKICEDVPFFCDFYDEYRNVDNGVWDFEKKIKKIGLSIKRTKGQIWKLSERDIGELEDAYFGDGNMNKKQKDLSDTLKKKVALYKAKWGIVIAAVKQPYISLELLLSVVDGVVFKEGSSLCSLSVKLREWVIPSEFIGEDFDKLNEGDEYVI